MSRSRDEDWRMVIGLLLIGLVSVLATSLFLSLHPIPEGTLVTTDSRRAAVARLNEMSRTIGWGAWFSTEAETLRMDGSILCAREFLSLVPPEARSLVLKNFVWFRCVNGNTRVVIQIK